MNRQRIRPKALCVVETDGEILVTVYDDPNTGERYYRPLGGSIEFGEYSADAVVREFREEIGADLVDIEYLDTLENVFSYGGEPAHELVAIYDGRLGDDSLYERDEIRGYEAETDASFRAIWKPLTEFKAGDDPLYPDGLLELLVGDDHGARWRTGSRID